MGVAVHVEGHSAITGSTIRTRGLTLGTVFGPLNGVRVALVGLAVLAGLIAILAGYPGAALVLFAGVAIHGLGWLYLYRQKPRTPH